MKRIPRHFIVAASAWISRIITAFIQIISIRILIKGIGSEQYAAFALLNGLIGWYMLADMGIGISLQNYISEQRARNEPYHVFLLVSAILALSMLVLLIGLLYLISPYVAPLFLRHFDFLSSEGKIQAFSLSGALLIGGAIGSIGYKIWYAQQKGYLSNIIPAMASIIGLVGIWLVIKSDLPDKLFLSLFAFLAPPAFLALVTFGWKVVTELKSDWRVDSMTMQKLMKRAFSFWVFSIMAAAVLQIDYIIISQFLKPRDIIVYTIATKVFGLAMFFYTAMTTAFWPVFTELVAKNDWKTIGTNVKRLLLFGVGFMMLFTVLMLFFMPYITTILSPNEVLVVPTLFIVLLGVYQMILIWVNGFAVVLQSMSDMRIFLVWTPIQAFGSFIFQWTLTPIYGIYGVLVGLMLSFLITAIWLLPYKVFSIMKTSSLSHGS